MPHPFDSTAVRAWVALALEAVGEGREEIDAINVFPVADGDTGTNLYRTLDAAARDLEADGHGPSGSPGSPGPPLRVLARGALLGACGNSGTILAQLLRGMAEVYGAGDGPEKDEHTGDGDRLAEALRQAARSAYRAVAHPVEGTMLTVAGAAAAAAARAAGEEPDAVARAAYEGARTALSETTGQLDVLRRAGVVDAGGSGLVAVLGALADALTDPGTPLRSREILELHGPPEGGLSDVPGAAGPKGEGGPSYEVMYLLEAGDAAVAALRERLDGLGDSLVVGGGDRLWSVHVHVDDAGAAVEAGIGAG
ncbi:MAG: DAK2 domain-containing protein, partial [Streptomyces sp.]|uniref:DAK2 domain-containing protein n=1 Tax=Streptomyces sp. TaxID=1931 RepID=UPI003D6B113C